MALLGGRIISTFKKKKTFKKKERVNSGAYVNQTTTPGLETNIVPPENMTNTNPGHWQKQVK